MGAWGSAASGWGDQLLRALLAAVVAWALIVGVNFANDYSDGVRGTDDDRTGPLRLTASGAASPGAVKRAAFAAFGVAGVAGVALAGERVAVSGPMVARGYRTFEGAPALPASALGAFRPDGWFVTSDTGVIEDGVLRVTGRVDTVIDSGGLKLHPEVLEHALMAVRGVDAAVVVGVPDERLGQAICAVYLGALSPAEVVEALDDVPRWQLPKRLLRVDSVPVTGPGKPDRQAVVRLFMES